MQPTNQRWRRSITPDLATACWGEFRRTAAGSSVAGTQLAPVGPGPMQKYRRGLRHPPGRLQRLGLSVGARQRCSPESFPKGSRRVLATLAPYPSHAPCCGAAVSWGFESRPNSACTDTMYGCTGVLVELQLPADGPRQRDGSRNHCKIGRVGPQ